MIGENMPTRFFGATPAVVFRVFTGKLKSDHRALSVGRQVKARPLEIVEPTDSLEYADPKPQNMTPSRVRTGDGGGCPPGKHCEGRKYAITVSRDEHAPTGCRSNE